MTMLLILTQLQETLQADPFQIFYYSFSQRTKNPYQVEHTNKNKSRKNVIF